MSLEWQKHESLLPVLPSGKSSSSLGAGKTIILYKFNNLKSLLNTKFGSIHMKIKIGTRDASFSGGLNLSYSSNLFGVEVHS